jgi:SAM-dependent methyltransferase
MDVRAQMERIYGELPLDEIPWNLEAPPRLLVDLVQSGRVPPCRAVDLGCGAGNYAVWLALQGFDVTGIDLSAAAIVRAQQLAWSKGAACRFIVSDLLEPTDAFDASFDFAFDWLALHHVFPDDRPRYVAHVLRMLRPGGPYLSVCFSEDDQTITGEGKYRQPQLGTLLYLSSEQEIRDLFEPWFAIEELTTVEIEGKRAPHRAVKALMMNRARGENRLRGLVPGPPIVVRR